MGSTGADASILETLESLHAAQRRGDADTALDAFTDEPQGATNGVPRRVSTLRDFFRAHREALSRREADLSAVEILHDPQPERFWRYVEGEKVAARANALVLPVRYRNSGGLGMAPPNAQGWSPYPDTLFMMYTMVLCEDGKWRIVHDRVLPDPHAAAYDRDLIAAAGVVLNQNGMAWTRRIEAPANRVWREVSTSAGLRRWWLGRDKHFEIELKKGGIFRHHWGSVVHAFEKQRSIDFDEFRIELRPDGGATVLDFIVYNMNGDEWRAFWQVAEAPVFYDQFGGVDPWSASGWHRVLDRLEAVVTGQPLDDPDAERRGPWPAPLAITHFYLQHLRAHSHHRALSDKQPLSAPGADRSTFGLPRTVEGYGPPKPRNAAGPSAAKAEIVVEELPEQAALVIEGKTTAGNYLNALASGVQRVRKLMAKKRIEPAGRPFLRYLHVDETGSERIIRYAAGVPVAAGTQADRAIKMHTLPKGRALTLDFTGSYEQVPEAWHRIRQYLRKHDLQPQGADPSAHGGWHVLLNDPREVGLENARSRLYLPIRT